MKLGGTNHIGAVSGTLVERMRAVHAEAQAKATRAGAARVGQAPPAARDRLEVAMMAIARKALRGAYPSESILREHVLDLVLAAQNRGPMEGQDEPSFEETMKAALIDDPTFAGEVEQMLLQAAKALGREDAVR